MIQLLLAVFVYATIFVIDYAIYRIQGANYRFVSLRTWLLLTAGQITILFLYREPFAPFLERIGVELAFLSFITLLLIWFTYTLTREQDLVCFRAAKTERCLTPYYVFVKGTEIVFQQLVYCAVALSLVAMMGINFLTYITFVLVLLIMHVAIILGSRMSEVKQLTFGIAVIAAPIFYIFTEIGYFFPAMYLHVIMYIFYWLTFADFDTPEDHIVDNRG